MGPPVTGEPIPWHELQRVAPIARKGAVEQLISLWKRQRERTDTEPLWGDEIEYTLINLDARKSRATLLLNQEEVLQKCQKQCANTGEIEPWNEVMIQPEWGRYMIEATPGEPYGGEIMDLLRVEGNMKRRRKLIRECLSPDQHPASICVFPGLGMREQFMIPERSQESPTQTPHSEIYCPVSRYIMVTKNLAARRQRRVETYIPVYRDDKTESPFHDKTGSYEYPAEHQPPADAKEGHVHLDGIGLGLGSCSIQVTFQAPNESEVRWLHDQLIAMGPIMLALTAATPIYKGYLVDTDVRWSRISDCFDDRTPEELATTPPRYSWNRTYISQEKPADANSKSPLNPMDQAVKQRLLDGGMDEPLAMHFATILSRDPVMLNRVDLENFDPNGTGLFDVLYSSVWQYVRLKMPLSDDGPGWRVEFRPMEVQLTDFDNAAFSIFMYLLSRAITTFHLNFYVPIDKLTESMERAQRRNAALEERVWFRRSGWSSTTTEQQQHDRAPRQRKPCCVKSSASTSPYALLTMDEIINGEDPKTPCRFPGLVNIVWAYLQYKNTSLQEQSKIKPYLDVISKRANGELPTPAQWMRSFVSAHDDYRRDSYVGEKIRYDLMQEIVGMGE
ncbi:glutamate cysteine ligase [Aspergillus heteromorphus CBS 117.55]|uniref:Glutamate--cysteine ligase n=1 Tax=Aspergillus heteromorphus CBS 117.55 TaxID=1448321 RepID=A0A317WA37_9EURO|nr:glutamate cysteine ligase [Aspergillus heteromorphus CBS 117.55]PWY81858.1 glutamate cysteine ligase [Aspergillus heteromorphus CBS 117.55]